jgi:lysozyme family protein
MVRADNLPSGLDYAVFDYAVNSGPSRAIKHLQEVLGVTADGIMGNVTIARASEPETKDKIRALCDRRMKFLRGLPTWETFGKGWSRRVDGVLSKATGMVSADTAPTTAPPHATTAAAHTIDRSLYWSGHGVDRRRTHRGPWLLAWFRRQITWISKTSKPSSSRARSRC